MPKRASRPRDPLQLAKLIGDIATGQVVEAAESPRVRRARKAGKQGRTGTSRSPHTCAESRDRPHGGVGALEEAEALAGLFLLAGRVLPPLHFLVQVEGQDD